MNAFVRTHAYVHFARAADPLSALQCYTMCSAAVCNYPWCRTTYMHVPRMRSLQLASDSAIRGSGSKMYELAAVSSNIGARRQSSYPPSSNGLRKKAVLCCVVLKILPLWFVECTAWSWKWRSYELQSQVTGTTLACENVCLHSSRLWNFIAIKSNEDYYSLNPDCLIMK